MGVDALVTANLAVWAPRCTQYGCRQPHAAQRCQPHCRHPVQAVHHHAAIRTSGHDEGAAWRDTARNDVGFAVWAHARRSEAFGAFASIAGGRGHNGGPSVIRCAFTCERTPCTRKFLLQTVILGLKHGIVSQRGLSVSLCSCKLCLEVPNVLIWRCEPGWHCYCTTRHSAITAVTGSGHACSHSRSIHKRTLCWCGYGHVLGSG